MVAAPSANQGLDVRLASTLGSLLHAHTQILHPRWRLDAVVRINATLRRFGVAGGRLRVVAQHVVARAPSPVRVRLTELLFDAFDAGTGPALSMLVDALWHRDQASSHVAAIRAALALGDHERARAFAATDRRYLGPRLQLVLRHGFDPHDHAPAFVASPAMWDSFAPSMPLLVALVDAGMRRAAERVLASLPEAERWMGIAHVARLELDRSLVRSVRGEGRRDASMLLLVRHALAAGRVDRAADCAAAIARPLLAQRACLEIARALFERGRISEAFERLRFVCDPRLWAGNVVLRNEIRLARRSDRETERVKMPRGAVAAFREAPTWLDLQPTTPIAVREDLVRSAQLLRAGLRVRSRDLVSWASARLGRDADVRAYRRAYLAILARSGIAIEPAMVGLGCPALVAESIALQLEELAAQSSVATTMVPQPLAAVDRALRDEGVALSSEAPRRRRVLIEVARSSLRSALAEPADVLTEVVEARLRTLVHLGGQLGSDAIANALATLPVRDVVSTRAIEALCRLEPRVATSILLGRLAAFRAGGVDIDHVVAVLEQHGGVAVGFARALSRLWQTAERLLGRASAGEWLERLVVVWRQRFGRHPDVPWLDSLANRDRLPMDPGSLWDDVDALGAPCGTESHLDVALRLAEDATLLSALQLERPERIASDLKPWSLSVWREHLAYASSGPTLSQAVVHRFARMHGYGDHYEALTRGDLTALGVGGGSVTSGVHDLRIRLLDKRLDILTYLRFADVTVHTCFRSSSSYYRDRRQMTVDGVIDVWKDPLTFCFHIERRVGDTFVACGFCFGGFAELRDELAVVVNGIHVRPNTSAVRSAVVTLLEKNVCERLGIRELGIGCEHSARGPLPAGYEAKSVRLRRLRAVDTGGSLVSTAFDDISPRMNELIVVDHLRWRDS